MVERAHVRCPACKSVVPAMLLWAVGDACPRCQRALRVVRWRGAQGGVRGNTRAVRASWASAAAARSQERSDGSPRRHDQ
jgi:hypothetical protein